MTNYEKLQKDCEAFRQDYLADIELAEQHIQDEYHAGTLAGSDRDLLNIPLQLFQNRLQNKPQDGTARDLKRWCERVAAYALVMYDTDLHNAQTLQKAHDEFYDTLSYSFYVANKEFAGLAHRLDKM